MDRFILVDRLNEVRAGVLIGFPFEDERLDEGELNRDRSGDIGRQTLAGLNIAAGDENELSGWIDNVGDKKQGHEGDDHQGHANDKLGTDAHGYPPPPCEASGARSGLPPRDWKRTLSSSYA